MHTKQVFQIVDIGLRFYTASLQNYQWELVWLISLSLQTKINIVTLLPAGHTMPNRWTAWHQHVVWVSRNVSPTALCRCRTVFLTIIISPHHLICSPYFCYSYSSYISHWYISTSFLLPERDYVMFRYMLSQIGLSSVTLMHPTHGWSFRQYFLTTLYLGHPPTSLLSFTEVVLGEPPVGGVKRKTGSKIKRFWTCRTPYLINGTRYGLGYN